MSVLVPQEVAYGIFANHGGGVSWCVIQTLVASSNTCCLLSHSPHTPNVSLYTVCRRLCKKDANVSEECFGQNSLAFYGDTQWIRYPPMVQVRSEGKQR